MQVQHSERVFVVLVPRLVFAAEVQDRRHGRYQTDLRKKAGDAQRQQPSASIPAQGIVAGRGPEDLHVQQVPHGKYGREHLTDDRRRAHHAPFEDEYEDGVKNDVDNGVRKNEIGSGPTSV